ncbi:MAG: FHA domain-containing protein [Opitutaceae bacterium]|nr:FHA domain-containing protein [Verrucomicrobiales bacterium]
MYKFVLTGLSQPIQIDLRQGSSRVGRAPDNPICIPDGSVSAVHCELVTTAISVKVRDLESTNGTFVDGKPIREAVLSMGQILQLGQVELRLDHAVIDIVIPQLPGPDRGPQQTYLEDGSAACLNHPGVPAGLQCSKCSQVLCEECVRIVGLAGGRKNYFCSLCSGAAHRLSPPAKSKANNVSFLGRLTETFRMVRK